MADMTNSVGKKVLLRNGKLMEVCGHRVIAANNVSRYCLAEIGQSAMWQHDEIEVDRSGFCVRIGAGSSELDVVEVIQHFCCDLREVPVGTVVCTRAGQYAEITDRAQFSLTICIYGEGNFCLNYWGAFGYSGDSRYDVLEIKAMKPQPDIPRAVELNDVARILNRCMTYAPHLVPEAFLMETGADHLFAVKEGKIKPK